MPADALRVRGRHNAANALAALALATAIGCPLAPMLHGLREYGGEPHRVEYIATLDGVDAFDDSKGTNVGATVAALNGLGADKAPAKLVVILGGDGKGQDFAPLAEPVRRHARAVATIGRDAAAIEAALAATGVPLQRHATLEAATRWCFEQAHARRRGAAEPGLREPRHVPQLRAPRRGLRRRGAGDRGRARGAHESLRMSARTPCAQGDLGARRADARPRSPRAALSPRRWRRRARPAARQTPTRSRCATGSTSAAASRRGCSASTARWSGS